MTNKAFPMSDELTTGLKWMKENWEKNGWSGGSAHKKQVYGALLSLLDGNESDDALRMVASVTHPRPAMDLASYMKIGFENNTDEYASSDYLHFIYKLVTQSAIKN